MKLIKMPKIKQFRDIVRDVTKQATYKGLDENGKPIYIDCELPTLAFVGTTKLHGTNAGICYDGTNVWAQSKSNVITPMKDNAGFAMFVEKYKDYLMPYLDDLFHSDPNMEFICVYGEWAGKGIQKGVAISEIEKTFFVFGIKFKLKNEDEFRWAQKPETILGSISDGERIYSIYEFETYKVAINFNDKIKLAEAQNLINELVQNVDKVCPVGKALGVEGHGEGIVFTAWYKDTKHTFKAKGDSHSKSKVKTFKPIDNIKLKKIIEIADKVTPSWRLDQGITEVNDLINGGQIEMPKLGDYIRWVMKDIQEEDLDVIVESGLEVRELNKQISKICKDYYVMRYNEL